MAPAKRHTNNDYHISDTMVRDLMQQPLPTFVHTFAALLKRRREATGDIDEETLTEAECGALLDSFSVWLTRCSEAVTHNHTSIVASIVSLLNRSLRCATAGPFQTVMHRLCEGLLGNEHCRETLASLLDALFDVESPLLGSPFSSTGIEFMQLVGYLCAQPTLKDTMGRLTLSRVLDAIRTCASLDPYSGRFNTHRALIEVVLELVVGSKANKSLPQWGPLIDVAMNAQDVFLQVQAVEVLYRVTKQPSSVPTHSHCLMTRSQFTEGIPKIIREMLLQLGSVQDDPRKLLDGLLDICRTAQDLRRESRPRDTMLAFEASIYLSTTPTEQQLLNAAPHCFLSPQLLVALIRGEPVTPLTIPLSAIRSIRFRKPLDVIVKLIANTEYFNLVLSMLETTKSEKGSRGRTTQREAGGGGGGGEDEGAAYVILRMANADGLTRLKNSPFKDWVDAEMEQRKHAETARETGKRVREDDLVDAGRRELFPPMNTRGSVQGPTKPQTADATPLATKAVPASHKRKAESPVPAPLMVSPATPEAQEAYRVVIKDDVDDEDKLTAVANYTRVVTAKAMQQVSEEYDALVQRVYGSIMATVTEDHKALTDSNHMRVEGVRAMANRMTNDVLQTFQQVEQSAQEFDRQCTEATEAVANIRQMYESFAAGRVVELDSYRQWEHKVLSTVKTYTENALESISMGNPYESLPT